MAAADFVQLNRTFHELSADPGERDDLELRSLFYTGGGMTWEKLLTQYRVVLLSEAGSGKTEEVRNVARQLRRKGRKAFFLRLEHLPTHFEDAFEEGSFLEFQSWLTSEDEGWLLLDSVDEARLRSPLDFELAIKRVARKIASALQRSHIVITGRTHAWRPKTDLNVCVNNLPYRPRQVAAEPVEQEHEAAENMVVVRESSREQDSPHFTIVTLDALDAAQMQTFARAKGVVDTRAFVDALERADALSFASRPQDLMEVVEFWQDHGSIGSRLELMRNSIVRRLTERDQNRAEIRPMNTETAHHGARLVAGATTMIQQQTLRVPDGAESLEGLPIARILPDWNEERCSTLLSRPIFDEALYGAVRFHQRSVREYLAAEWLHRLLTRESSRRTIEACFFRQQYGLEVVVPSARPLLPWMIILDDRIRDRALRLAPELVFEGGDPSQLPLDTRRRLLREICAQAAAHRSNRPSVDFAAVQRFASADLAADIAELLEQYAGKEDVVWLLLRMVWQGQLTTVLPAARSVALDGKASTYPRIAAFRAVAALGSPADQDEVRDTFLREKSRLDRKWLAELIDVAKPGDVKPAWLLRALAKARTPEQFHTDGLSDAIVAYVENAAVSEVVALAAGLSALLARPPMIERRSYEISKRYRWLGKIAALSVQRLIEAKQEAALLPSSLDILRRYAVARDQDDFELRKVQLHLPELVQDWPALQDRLFWFEVAKARKWLDKRNKERLTEWWRVSPGDSLWKWREQDFDRVIALVGDRTSPDDRLVALSIAFHLYRQSGRPRQQRDALRKAVAGNSSLEAQLRQYMRPPPQSAEMRALRREDRRWKKRHVRRALRDARNEEDWVRFLNANIDKLRDPGFDKADAVSNPQYYLYHKVVDEDGKHRWTSRNWRSLAPKYGDPVARAFRDGAVSYWRRNKPKLLSEGAEPDKTLLSTIFGLTGLGIEAAETPGWPDALTESEAELAARYAAHELNGFPPWLPTLNTRFPDAVSRVLLDEVRWELSTVTPERQSYYVLADVSWHGEWIWEKWAPILIANLRKGDPANVESLAQIMKIVQGSSLPDEQVRDLAATKVETVTALDHLALWYAVWVGVDPGRAIDSLARHLSDVKDAQSRLVFAMQFITHLLGGRRGQASTTRKVYRTVQHLKQLYLLMNEHIRRSEDIDRAGQGVYSPGLRDGAQDARDLLYNLLKETPGKEAYLALMEISEAHPDRSARPWFKQDAKAKAEQDVETGPWSIEQFVDFNECLERTPANHRQLFELACMRLHDLKNDLEEGDSSIASILQKVTLEADMRKYIGNWLREKAGGRYSIPQEEELADATRPDLRFYGAGFDAPVPMELKLADNWTGPHLFERLENQLCSDYLRDARSNRGIFALVYRGNTRQWKLPNSSTRVKFNDLVRALEEHWTRLSARFAKIDEIRVIGIDLTRRKSEPVENLEKVMTAPSH